MKKLALIALAALLVVALAIPAAAEGEEVPNLNSKWGTPVVDAAVDELYGEPVVTIDKTHFVVATGNSDGTFVDDAASAKIYVANDGEFLYVCAEVIDNHLVNCGCKSWDNDSVEVWLPDFLDGGGHIKVPMDAFKAEGCIPMGASAVLANLPSGDTSAFLFEAKQGTNSYIVECGIPYSEAAEEYLDEGVIGIAFQLNDMISADGFGEGAVCFGGQYYDEARMTGECYTLTLGVEPVETEAPAEETEAPAEETEAPAEETEAPSDDPSPVTADIAVIAAGIALAAAAVVVFKKH